MRVERYLWGEMPLPACPAGGMGFDLVLASDVSYFYEHEAHAALARTLGMLLRREQAQQKAPPRPPSQNGSSIGLVETEGSDAKPQCRTMALTRPATAGSSRHPAMLSTVGSCFGGGGESFGLVQVLTPDTRS